MKNKKLKPIFKSSLGSQTFQSWVISEFPENYQELIYVDVFCDNLGIYLEKSKSKIEIINDTDLGIIQTYRAIRDEYKYFIKKLNAIKCNNETFDTFVENAQKTYEDYIEKGINEFVLRKLSKSENKKSFINKKIKWDSIIDEVLAIKNRLQETFIMNKEALEVIQKFNNQDSFLFCNLPTNIKEQQINKIVHSLKCFSGQVIVTSRDHKLCRESFADWNCKRKMIQNKGKKSLECIWKNY